MRRTTAWGAVAVVTLAIFSASCSAGSDSRNPGGTPAVASRPVSSAPTAEPSPPLIPTATPVEKVRDAFAGLQATLDDSCTPADCAYFLRRVFDELHRLDDAMKASEKGPNHFAEPIKLIKELDTQVGSDQSFENLKEHQDALIATRNKINTWMQGHPDDYR
ncbi:hypothetical protein ACIBQ5_33190 [Streptomyces massasporeus]|uniref:hypothetical protein n=1 Tax=Streptomyces massasporeus TaxID=67324 RepID=UPI0037A0F9EB